MWIDVDEVLNEYRQAVIDIAEPLFGRTIDPMSHPGHTWDVFDIFSPEEKTELFKIVSSEGFCANLPVREGTQEVVQRLQGMVDLFVVTSPFNSRHWVYERDEWLSRHFGFDRSQIVHTSAKYRVEADACLDDKHSNVLTWHEHHPDGLAMIWPTFHTRNVPAPDGYIVRDWQDVLDRVQQISKETR